MPTVRVVAYPRSRFAAKPLPEYLTDQAGPPRDGPALRLRV